MAGKSRPKSKPGRKPVSSETRKAFLSAFRSSEGKKSIRALAKEAGIAPSTASRLLRQAGLSPEKAPPAAPAPDQKGNARLRDVAARAGVSVSTASLALRGSEKVTPGTRKKVREAADALQYRVHPHVAAQLAAVRRGCIPKRDEVIVYLHAHGLPDAVAPFEEIMKVPWGPHRKFHAAYEEAAARGFRLEYVDYHNPETPPERLADILHSRGIQGIFLDAPPQVFLNRPMNLKPFYLVAFHEQTELRAHLFSNNTFHNSLLLTCMLWRQGYRRIARIQSDATAIGELYRQDAGYHHAQFHLASPEQRLPTLYLETYAFHLQYWLRYGKWHRARNRVDERAWLERQDLPRLQKELHEHRRDRDFIRNRILKLWLDEYQPDVLIGHHFAIPKWLETMGIQVPGDLPLAHCNLNEDVADWSGIRQAEEQLAKEAVQHMIDQISLGRLKQPQTPIRHLFTGSWIEGDTTPSLQASRPPLNLQRTRFIQRVLNEPMTM